MKKFPYNAALAASLLAAALPAFAQNASKAEVIALVDKAVANIDKKGIEEACKDFADPKGGFIQNELYVFVQDDKMQMTCHAANPKMNGKDMSAIKDATGKQFSKEMRDIAMSNKPGWVDYSWINPISKAIEPKTSYIRLAAGKYTVGVGIYKK